MTQLENEPTHKYFRAQISPDLGKEKSSHDFWTCNSNVF